MLVDKLIIKILISEQLKQTEKQALLDAYESGTLKKQYRKFAKAYHPDRNPDPTAELSFQELGNINLILEKLEDGESLSHSEIQTMINLVGHQIAFSIKGFKEAYEVIMGAQQQQQRQRKKPQVSMQDLVAGAENIVKTQNAKAFLNAYISLCDMARNVSPPIRNADRRISSAQSAAAEFLKTVNWLTAPIDTRTKLTWFQQMLDAGFFDTEAEPGSGRVSYNLLSSLDTGVLMMHHFHDLIVELGYEIGYYEDEDEDIMGDKFDAINNMKDFFNTYLEELKNYTDYSKSEKKTLKKNFIWLLNTWYKNVRDSGFNDQYDRELEENLTYISNLGARKENIRNKFKKLYYNAKRNRKKRKRNNARIFDRRR